jgi:ABC-type amino acid transport substrate-binding protein
MNKVFLLIFSLYCFTASADEVVIATLEWRPYISNSKKSPGSSREIIEKAFKAVGHEVRFEFLPWIRAMKYAESGKVDAIAPIYYSKKREEAFYFSSSFQESPLVLFKSEKSKIKYEKQIDLEAYTLGLVRGYKNTEYIDSNDKISKSFVLKDLFNIKKLAQNHVDLIVIDEFVGKLLIAENSKTINSKLVVVRPNLDSKKLHLGFSKKSPKALRMQKDFERGLKLINIKAVITNANLKFGIK